LLNGDFIMQQVIRAVYEDGVLKPLDPVHLSEQEVVELRIETAGEQRRVVSLGGSWASYAVEEAPSFEEIQYLTHGAHCESLNRLLDQLDTESDDHR